MGKRHGWRKDHRPTPQNTQTTASSPPLILWLRGVSGVSVLIGLAGLITTFFWWAVAFTYCGLVLSLWDLLTFEQVTRTAKRLTAITIIGLIMVFTFGVVARSAPLQVEAYAVVPPHLNGDRFAGIPWNDQLFDVRVWIRNETSMDYDGADFVVDANQFLIGIAQLHTIPKCAATLATEVEAHATMTDEFGKHFMSPPIGRTLGVGYRIICEKFPTKTAIELVLATASVSEKRTPPTIVTVRGTYHGAFRSRSLDSKISVDLR